MAMTWAYVEDAADANHAPTEWENSMHSPYAGATGEMLTESDLWHDDHQE